MLKQKKSAMTIDPEIIAHQREKKEQGDKPCSRNCVDPIGPAIMI
jgi:hypothetical protein